MTKQILEVDIIKERMSGAGVVVKNLVSGDIVSVTTEIALNRQLTIITGKTLTTNDIFIIASNPIEGCGAQIVLIGDGSHSPVLTACDYQVGTYDSTAAIANLLTFEYINGKVWVSILNGGAV